MPNVLWVSAGAVGAYFGGRLQQGGASVAVAVRSDYEAVKANGFRISAAAGEFTFSPDGVYSSVAEYPGTPDYVIVSSKVLPFQLKKVPKQLQKKWLLSFSDDNEDRF